MRHLALVAALCAASAADAATELTFGLAQGVSVVRTDQGGDPGLAAAFDVQAERSAPGRVLTFGLAGDIVGHETATGVAALSFADRSDGRIATFDLSHRRQDEGGFDPQGLLAAPTSTTRGRFEIGRAAGGPIDWSLSGALFHEQGDGKEASGRLLGVEFGAAPRPDRRIALRLGHEERRVDHQSATYQDLGVLAQSRRPRGRDEARLGMRQLPEGMRIEAAVARLREMPRGSTAELELGLAATAEGQIAPIGEIDLRLGLLRQSRIDLTAGHRVVDDPLWGEVADLRLDLNFHHRPTRLTRVEVDFGLFRRDPLSGAEGDSGVRGAARLSHALTREWSLAAEVEHRRLDAGGTGATHRSEISVMLERRITAHGF